MKYGLPFWFTHLKNGLDYAFDTFYSIGLDYLELSLNYPMNEIASDRDFIKKLKKLSERYEIEINVHAPHTGVEMASPIDEIRDISLKILKKSLKIAKKLESRYLNFHLQVNPVFLKLEETREKVYCNSRYILEKISKNAKKMLITVENDGKALSRPEELEILKDYENIMLCFDIAHTYSANIDIYEWFGFYDNIYVTHIHDLSFKDGKGHKYIGEGDLDFNYISSYIKIFNPEYVLVEIFYDISDIHTLEKNIKKVRDMFR